MSYPLIEIFGKEGTVIQKQARAKTVIFMGPDEVHNEMFDHLLKDGFYNNTSTFVLVHILNDKSRENFPPSVDVKKDSEVEKYINTQFDKFEEKFVDEATKPKVERMILLNKDTKLQAVNFLKESKADSCVVATRGEQGLSGMFTDSMAYYLVAHAPCDVLVIRP